MTIQAADPSIHAVVSASAGTGKTWLLIARLLRLLLKGVEPGSILAITFTKKAAAEIEERLYHRLRDWASSSDDELREQLQEIGADTSTASIQAARELYEKLLHCENEIMIMTFHAFCAEILRLSPVETDIPHNFEILENNWEIKQQAYDLLLRKAATETQFGETLSQFLSVCNYKIDNLRPALFNFLDHRNSWLAYTQNGSLSAEDIALQLRAQILAATKPFLLTATWIRKFEDFSAILKLHDTQTFHNCNQCITEALKDTPVKLNEDFYDKIKFAFYTAEGTRKKAFKETNALSASLTKGNKTFAEFDILLGELYDVLEKAKEYIYGYKNWVRNQTWYELGQAFIEIYQTIKDSQQLLDFDDLEWRANQLLNQEQRGVAWVQCRLSIRISHILVDEFQDTNPAQWQLLKPLLQEMAAQESNDSVFIVGDIKQSIYGFRRANPQLQQEASQWIQQHLQGKEYSLDKSRRSSPEIIELVNNVCNSPAMKTQLTDFIQHETFVNIPGQCARFPLAVANEREPEEQIDIDERYILGDFSITKIPPVIKEAEYIATKIRELVDEKLLVHSADGTQHSVNYSDIMILFRRNAPMSYFEMALRQKNIPYSSVASSGLLESLEISDLLALLHLFINPTDNLALAHVLRSPIFSATNENLVTLARSNDSLSWLQRLEKLSVDLSEPFWQRSWHLLKTWLQSADTLPLHDLFDKIYSQGDLIRRYRAAVLPEYRDIVERNLISFLHYTLDFAAGRYPGLDGFLHYIERYKKYANQQEISNNSDSGTDCVKLLTIHKAKGLEAAIVFLADCGPSKLRSDSYNTLVDWPTEQLRPQTFLILPPVKETDRFTKQFIEAHHQREQKEEANLLYVAMTRARQYLFVSANSNRELKDGDLCWYSILKEFLQELAPPESLSDNVSGITDAIEEIALIKPEIPFNLPLLQLEKNPSKLSAFTPDAESDEDGLIRGIVIHKALELLNSGTNIKQLPHLLSTNFSEVKEANIALWLDESYRLITNKQLAELFNNPAHQKTFNEVPLSFIYNNEQFYGFIDRLCISQDSAWVVDYKTHTNAKQRMSKLKDRYHPQMFAYTMGVKQLYPKLKIRSSLLLTETATLLDYDFS